MSKRKYEVKTIKFKELEFTNPTVPKFQRGLVWSEKTKKEFIKTIHEGFPFGSILLYNTDKLKDSYSIIDGLQRYTTIKSFLEEPDKYWNEVDKNTYQEEFDHFLEDGNGSVLNEKQKKISKRIFEDLLRSQDRLTDDFAIAKKDDWVYDIVSKYNDEYHKYVAKLDKEIKNYIDIASVDIPVIFFEGDSKELSTAFENLNKSGVKLNKYQILTASWHGYIIKVTNGQLEDKVVSILSDRYARLVSKKGRGLGIDGFDPNQFKKDRKINLAEFAYSLGKIVIDNTPSLYGEYAGNNDKSDDKIDVIGFYTLAIVSNIDNRNLEDISNKFNYIEENHQEILIKIDNISKELDKIFQRKLAKRGTIRNKAKGYENGINTDFKFLSYIASLYTYYLDKKKFNKILSNIFGYFVFDGIDGTWQNAGDSKLADYFEHGENQLNDEYLEPYSKDDAKAKYEVFIREGIAKPSIKFNGIIKSLVTIHSNLTYDSSFGDGSDFDFEHVISAQKLLGRDGHAYEQGKIPGGFLGNAMYLEQSHNRGKQSDNLYQDAANVNSSSHDSSKRIIDSEDLMKMICYPSEDEITQAEKSIENKEYQSAIDLIRKRSARMFEEICTHIL